MNFYVIMSLKHPVFTLTVVRCLFHKKKTFLASLMYVVIKTYEKLAMKLVTGKFHLDQSKGPKMIL